MSFRPPALALLALSALLLSAPPLRAAEPPPATLAQLEKALERVDVKHSGRALKARTTAIIEKPGGGSREEEIEESVVKPDGTVTTTVIKATKEGKDVTAERREKKAKRDAERAKEKAAAKPEPTPAKKEKAGIGLKIPTGDDRKLFVLTEPKSEGDLLVVSYEPAKGVKGDDLSKGRFAWNAATGEPAWLEAQMVDPPTGLKEMHMRTEFKGAGDAIYTSLFHTTGVGGLLWIKRRFDVKVEIEPLP